MNSLDNNQCNIGDLSVCAMQDTVEELVKHINSINALLYIGNFTNIHELDNEVYSGFLNAIDTINNSSNQLATKIKEYFNNEV